MNMACNIVLCIGFIVENGALLRDYIKRLPQFDCVTLVFISSRADNNYCVFVMMDFVHCLTYTHKEKRVDLFSIKFSTFLSAQTESVSRA